MREISIEERATIAARLAAIRMERESAEKRLREFFEGSRLIREAIDDADEREALLLQEFGVEVAGFCDHDGCGRLLFVGEQGQRPYADEPEAVFCAEHGMTFGDLMRHWEENDPSEDFGEEGEMRADALQLVEAHVANGGSLDDKIPGVL